MVFFPSMLVPPLARSDWEGIVRETCKVKRETFSGPYVQISVGRPVVAEIGTAILPRRSSCGKQLCGCHQNQPPAYCKELTGFYSALHACSTQPGEPKPNSCSTLCSPVLALLSPCLAPVKVTGDVGPRGQDLGSTTESLPKHGHQPLCAT